MAITIIKPGKDTFNGHCRWCGCDFTYNIADVEGRGVVGPLEVECPHCDLALTHYGEHGTSLEAPAGRPPGPSEEPHQWDKWAYPLVLLRESKEP
jgi:hypothetical protein